MRFAIRRNQHVEARNEPRRAVMALIRWCRKCGTWFSAIGATPTICPNCDREPTPDPLVAYELTPKDKRLLKSFLIQPD